MLRRLGIFLPVLLVAITFGGCPQHLVKIAEDVTPPKDYKPIYMTSTVGYDKIIEAYRANGGKWPQALDSLGRPIDQPPTTGSDSLMSSAAAAGPLRMDIRAVDDSRYPDEVVLRAFVYDTSGRFVMGLAPPYYTAADWRRFWPTLTDSCSGQRANIDSFTVTEVRQDRREPYAVAFVLDHSGSMGDEKIRRLRTAVGRTLRIIRKGDQITTVKFGGRCAVDVPLTEDSARYRREFVVEDIQPPFGNGGTALFDAAIVGINELEKAPPTHRRAMILFTDGMDGNSTQTVEAVHRIAREKHVTLYTVAYGEADETVMRNMATYTGGRMYRIYSYKEFPYVFADIYRGLNNYYRISYRPPSCQGMHTATATLALPDVNLHMSASGRYDRSIFTPFDSVGTMVLVAIEFDYDKATIRPVSAPRLNEVAEVLRNNPDMKVEIRGHTDDRGSDEYNMRLSQDRAQSVADALVAMGIGRDRLTVKGFGESRPLVANDNDENRQKNRRTEFVITSRGKK